MAGNMNARPIAAVLVLLLALSPAAAKAHAMLLKSEPAVGNTVSPAPAQLTLHFSEGVEPSFSTVEVTDSTGARMDKPPPRTAPDDNETLIISLKPLSPGEYDVRWHATSVDTHKTQGHFTFRVGP